VRRQHEDARVREVSADVAAGLHARVVGQLEVHEHNVRSATLGLNNRGRGGNGLSHDFELGHGPEDRTQADHHELVVIDEHDPDRFFAHAVRPPPCPRPAQ